MIFFTEVKNKPVRTEDNVLVGWLDDLMFDFKDTPTITKIVIKSEKLQHARLFVPIQYVIQMAETIILAKNYMTDYLHENELFVMKNLIDKQIIDIEGRKVVRVNDVIFKQSGHSGFVILGVDTGLLGVLRWIGLEKIVKHIGALFGKKLTPSTLPWHHIQPLELTEGKVKLNVNQEKLEDLQPEDLADYLEATSMDNIVQTINLLDAEFAAEVIAELNLSYQVLLFKQIGIKKTVEIITLMDPDEAIDALNQFSDKRRENILKGLKKEKRQELQDLLSFSETEVGAYLTPEFFSIDADNTVGEVINQIRLKTENLSHLDCIYVTNSSEQLIGVCNLHELLMQPPQNPVRMFMIENPITVYLKTPLKSVQRKLIKYKLSELPVVNEHKKMIGLITFDDVGELFLEKL